jgi:hypothetical protein
MIEIYPAELSFTHNIGDYNPTAQKAWIRNSGTGTLFWEITKDCNWIDFWPSSGESIGQEKQVVVTVDATGLFGGEYNCTLTISDANAANSPGYLPVSLLVRPPHIGVTPTVMSFVCPEGGASPEPQILSVWNANVGKLN